jgi:hypothetical protein
MIMPVLLVLMLTRRHLLNVACHFAPLYVLLMMLLLIVTLVMLMVRLVL